jgi:hypothetical protein
VTAAHEDRASKEDSVIRKQVTAFLKNERGALAKAAGALAAAGVNIEGISVLDNTDCGQARLLVSSAAAAAKALKRLGISCSVQDVAVISLPDKPGALAAAAAKLSKAGVNINYAYGTTCKCGCDCRCQIVISVSDLKKAKSLIR